jgi:hypothetical protein
MNVGPKTARAGKPDESGCQKMTPRLHAACHRAKTTVDRYRARTVFLNRRKEFFAAQGVGRQAVGATVVKKI